MTQPNFLIIGSPKSGTTSLSQSLAAHPDVYFLPHKEANFFNRHYDRGFDWYTDLFSGHTAQTAIGEGTPAYAMGVEAAQIAQRIHSHLPDVKLIYMVRDPIERLASHYVQDLANGRDDIGLSQAVLTRPYMIETSKYHARMADYLALFDPAQIHVIFFEDFVGDYDATFARCLDFLGVASDTVIPQAAAGTRDTRARQRWIIKKLEQMPFYEPLRRRIPEAYVQRLRRWTRKKVDLARVDTTLSDAARAHAVAALASDTAAFLDQQNRPADFWTPGRATAP